MIPKTPKSRQMPTTLAYGKICPAVVPKQLVAFHQVDEPMQDHIDVLMPILTKEGAETPRLSK